MGDSEKFTNIILAATSEYWMEGEIKTKCPKCGGKLTFEEFGTYGTGELTCENGCIKIDFKGI